MSLIFVYIINGNEASKSPFPIPLDVPFVDELREKILARNPIRGIRPTSLRLYKVALLTGLDLDERARLALPTKEKCLDTTISPSEYYNDKYWETTSKHGMVHMLVEIVPDTGDHPISDF